MVAKSAPDGHTPLMISQAHTAMEPLVKERPYDLPRDFAPVAAINRVDLVMVVPGSLQVRTLQDFIALAKARPRQLSYASWGHARFQRKGRTRPCASPEFIASYSATSASPP
jgi:tripartite-type tricarboxylate transporter receptor subunit TctC